MNGSFLVWFLGHIIFFICRRDFFAKNLKVSIIIFNSLIRALLEIENIETYNFLSFKITFIISTF